MGRPAQSAISAVNAHKTTRSSRRRVKSCNKYRSNYSPTNMCVQAVVSAWSERCLGHTAQLAINYVNALPTETPDPQHVSCAPERPCHRGPNASLNVHTVELSGSLGALFAGRKAALCLVRAAQMLAIELADKAV